MSHACDCHVHVIGPADAYPMAADRHYTPDLADLDALRTHMARVGAGRTVVVQPSVYGTDNRCTLDALDRLEGRGRGIAVVADDTAPDALRALHRRGVRGLRINVESAGVRDPRTVGEALARWAGRIADLGWHLQVYASLDTLADAAGFVDALPVPVVIDHFGMTPAGTGPEDARLRALVDLLRAGNAYVKLSAPYRIAPDARHAGAVTALARLFADAAPTRVLWGSDWPHTNREAGKAAHEVSRYRDVPAEGLVAALGDWLPDAARRQQVLVDNPARLYGF